MDAEIPLLTQAHELGADQHFDKKRKKSTQLSAGLTNLSRTEKHLQGWVIILEYGADQCYNNGEFCYKNQSDT